MRNQTPGEMLKAINGLEASLSDRNRELADVEKKIAELKTTIDQQKVTIENGEKALANAVTQLQFSDIELKFVRQYAHLLQQTLDLVRERGLLETFTGKEDEL